jgi:hypothetical protein
MRQNHHSIVRALRRNSSVTARFWASVSKGETQNGCWEWIGCSKPGSRPVFSVSQYTIAASRVAWFMETGDLPAGGRVEQLCTNALCVRPSHLGWRIGRRTECVLDALNDGYIRLADFPSAQFEQLPRATRVFRLMSSDEDEAA